MNLEQPNNNQNGNGASPDAAPEQPSTEQLDPRILADLARSGLDNDDARNMHVRQATFSELAPLFGKRMAARVLAAPVYFIPYFDFDTDQCGPFGRYKFLDDCGKDAGEKLPKYMQPPGATRRLYFPVVPGVISAQDWTKVIFSHTELALYNVESEKAAYRLAKAGTLVVACGGCWSHVGRAQGQALLKDYERFDLKGREVVELLDSDVSDNPAVLAAQWDFCYGASALGAIPTYINLPNGPDGEKWGPDDFAVNKSVQELLALPRDTFDAIKNLWALNKRYALITGDPAGMLLDTETGKFLRTEAFKTVTNKLKAFVPKLGAGKDKDGNPKAKLKWQEVKAGTEWLEWAFRREYTQEEFSPGQPRDLANGAYNPWQGFGCEAEEAPLPLVPGESPTAYWEMLLGHLCADEPPEMRRYLEANIAYPIQVPGGKNHNMPVLKGDMEGSGKTLVLEFVSLLHGPSGKIIGNEQMFGRFNGWQRATTFAGLEELESPEGQKHSEQKVRRLVTQETATIELKGVDTYEQPDHTNYMGGSNEKKPLQLNGYDRRYGVIHVKRKLGHKLGAAMSEWFKRDGGMRAVRYRLEHLDISWYDPHQEAPINQSKRDVIDRGRPRFDKWAEEFAADGPPPLCYWDDLKAAGEAEFGKPLNITAFTNALAPVGIIVVGRVVLSNGARVNVYGTTNEWRDKFNKSLNRLGNKGISEQALREGLLSVRSKRAEFFSLSDLDRWAISLAINPDRALSGGAAGFVPKDLWTTSELITVGSFDRNPTAASLEKSLALAGIPCRNDAGDSLAGERIWIVSGGEHWLKQGAKEIAVGYKKKEKKANF